MRSVEEALDDLRDMCTYDSGNLKTLYSKCHMFKGSEDQNHAKLLWEGYFLKVKIKGKDEIRDRVKRCIEDIIKTKIK